MPDTPRNQRCILGEAVRCIRELKHLTQDDLADKAHVDPGYLSKLENGVRTTPSLAVITRLANALEVNIRAISYMATVYVITDEDAA